MYEAYLFKKGFFMFYFMDKWSFSFVIYLSDLWIIYVYGSLLMIILIYTYVKRSEWKGGIWKK